MLKAMRKYIKETENLSAVNVVKIFVTWLLSGGIPCGNCDKKLKTDKTMEQHRRRYH